MIVGEWLIAAIAVLIWLAVLLFAALYWHERRFLMGVLREMQAINDEWYALQRADADARQGE